MNHVLLVFLSLSVSGSILALILFALRPLIKKRLSQTWQYYIWLVVILRFLLPFSPDISLVGQAVSRFEKSITAPMAAAEPDSGLPDQLILQASADSQAPAQLDEEAAPLPEAATADRWRDILDNVWLVWAVGALMLFAYKVISYNGFLRFVKGRAKKVTDDRILEIYREELSAAKVRKLPLRVSDRVGSPMLIGVFRPTLVIPILDAGEDELRHILRHELTHYRRFDYCYKWLVQITKCLHWFNPLIYQITKQIDKCCELSCDEANIRRLDRDGRESYGNALMASLISQENYSDFVISMTMSENVKLVKERLDLIVEYKKKSGVAIGATFFLTLLLLCGFTFTGAYATPLNDTGIPVGAAPPIVSAGEQAAPTSQPAQAIDSRLTLVEQEYTIAELRALNVSGLIIGALSENIEVTRGGDALKISYYQMANDEYVIAPQPDMGGTINELAMRRSTPATPDEPRRTITITVPENAKMEKVLSLETDSGSIAVNHCTAEVLGVATQSGRILINGGSVSELLTMKTNSGTALISGTILPERGTSIVGTEFYTQQGTILFQPAESAWDYRYNLNTGTDAQIYVNGRQYQGGGGNINNYSKSRISFETTNGSLIVQDFSMGRLSLDDAAQQTTSIPQDAAPTPAASVDENDVVPVQTVDTITWELIQANNGWWDPIAPFLPYMSSSNAEKIARYVSAFYAAPDVSAYTGNGSNASAALTSDILDGIALQLMQNIGNLSIVEVWFPHMTAGGVKNVANLYISKGNSRESAASALPYLNGELSGMPPNVDYGDGFNFHRFNGIESMTQAEVDAMALEYIEREKAFGHVYNMRPYMSTAGIDAAVLAYLEQGGDPQDVATMLQFTSKALRNSLARSG